MDFRSSNFSTFSEHLPAQPTSLDLFYQILAYLYRDESYSCVTLHTTLFCTFSSLSNPSSTFTFSQEKKAAFFSASYLAGHQSFLSTCSVAISQLLVAFGSLTRGRILICFSIWELSGDILTQLIKLTIKCTIKSMKDSLIVLESNKNKPNCPLRLPAVVVDI